MSYTVMSRAEEARPLNSASCGGTATHFSAEGVLLCRTLEKYFTSELGLTSWRDDCQLFSCWTILQTELGVGLDFLLHSHD